ncbi:MAG: chromate efflux transporter [Flavipsychrobacter sp.]
MRTVFLYAITAFGGPQGHLGMMVRTFVQKRKDITEEELVEFNAFCQMLPGPSSTQTVMLIGMKRGGIPLALLTLLIWILPAAILMGAFSFLVTYIDTKDINTNLFKYVQPMSVGFICYAAVRMMKVSVRHVATWSIMIGCGLVTIFIRTPWIFPVLLLVAGVISNFSNKRIPDRKDKPKPIKWVNIWIFAVIFIVAGVLSQLAVVYQLENGRILNLFENFYRFGSIVFGGGQVLLPMMLFQFVNRPMSMGMAPLLTGEQLLTGYGVVQALPGPVFSICAYVGGLVMSPYGAGWQIAGCIVAAIAVFLPSTLLIFFLFPVYQNLKKYVVIYRALEGINAAIIGMIWASGFILFQTVPFEWTNVVVVAITFCILFFTKIPAPFIVLGWLLLGWTMFT